MMVFVLLGDLIVVYALSDVIMIVLVMSNVLFVLHRKQQQIQSEDAKKPLFILCPVYMK
uniref:Uncharacterized protein n=1 Tax=Arion vulgaris TaxID=1028688 RepID=A0A0B7AKQ7_9EUPU